MPSDGVSPAGEAPSPQTPHLLVQVQQLSKEKQSVEEELQRCQEAEQEASERVRRSDSTYVLTSDATHTPVHTHTCHILVHIVHLIIKVSVK